MRSDNVTWHIKDRSYRKINTGLSPCTATGSVCVHRCTYHMSGIVRSLSLQLLSLLKFWKNLSKKDIFLQYMTKMILGIINCLKKEPFFSDFLKCRLGFLYNVFVGKEYTSTKSCSCVNVWKYHQPFLGAASVIYGLVYVPFLRKCLTTSSNLVAELWSNVIRASGLWKP